MLTLKIALLDMHRSQKPEMVKKKKDKLGRVRVATCWQLELIPQIIIRLGRFHLNLSAAGKI